MANLVRILKDGYLKGSDASGYIKGGHTASCFMDIPLSSLKYVLNEANTNASRPRYEPYGVVISKKFGFEYGCRPVMYLSDREIREVGVAQSELWRVVKLDAVDGTGVNWLHEREWRSMGDFDLPLTLRAVLVKTPKEAASLQQRIDAHPHLYETKPLSIIPLTVLCQGLPYM
ncbi:hypothetical protein WJ21_24090 [Burkholderia vietnamiensis]|uniref:hypothetical protein n=1 Tax=Burkholderia vietnamiensis TaxID=60552 RepID=UPI0007586A6A|nr:hypothetical protein [Burkholderia vietnamiensis]KVF94860.1 hypothetical protein WJ21_24090 [Burkholderia vietnamiensis]